MGLPTPSKSNVPSVSYLVKSVLAAYLPVQMIVVFVSCLASHIALFAFQL